MPRFLQYLLGFAALILLQEFVLSPINLLSVVSVTIYIMVLILLPMEIKGAYILFVAAAMGLAVDMLQGTTTLAMMCMVWIGFLRQAVLNLTLGRDVVMAGGMPRSVRVGRGNFFRYVFVMCFLYATPYFLLEMMTMQDIWLTSIRIVASSTTTAALIYILHLPFSGKVHLN